MKLDNSKIPEPMRKNLKQFLSDDDFNGLVEAMGEIVFGYADGKLGVPSLLYVSLFRYGAAAQLLTKAKDLPGLAGDPLGNGFVVVGMEVKPGKGLHRQIWDIGRGFDGHPLVACLASEVWLTMKSPEQMKGPFVQPHDDPTRIEAMMFAALSFDGRARMRYRPITRDGGGLMRLGKEEDMAGGEPIVLEQFFRGYYARLIAKNSPGTPGPKPPKIHTDN